MIARQPVCVLDDALFTDIHMDLLATHGTHAVREVFGRYARLAVELGEKNTRKRQEDVRITHSGKLHRGLRSSSKKAKLQGEVTKPEDIFYSLNWPHPCWVNGEKGTDQRWVWRSDLTGPDN